MRTFKTNPMRSEGATDWEIPIACKRVIGEARAEGPMQCAKRSQRAQVSTKVLTEARDMAGSMARLSGRAAQDQLDHLGGAEDAELAGGETQAAADDQTGVEQAMHAFAIASRE